MNIGNTYKYNVDVVEETIYKSEESGFNDLQLIKEIDTYDKGKETESTLTQYRIEIEGLIAYDSLYHAWEYYQNLLNNVVFFNDGYFPDNSSGTALDNDKLNYDINHPNVYAYKSVDVKIDYDRDIGVFWIYTCCPKFNLMSDCIDWLSNVVDTIKRCADDFQHSNYIARNIVNIF